MSLKLYWNPKNPVHKLIPIVLVATGVPFEEVQLKDDSPHRGKLPPYIESFEGKTLDKTLAMAKFIAKRKHLMGKDPWELYSIEKGISLVRVNFILSSDKYIFNALLNTYYNESIISEPKNAICIGIFIDIIFNKILIKTFQMIFICKKSFIFHEN